MGARVGRTVFDADWEIRTWDAKGNPKRVIASLSSFGCARAAFDVAVIQFPDERITLQNGARVIQKHNIP